MSGKMFLSVLLGMFVMAMAGLAVAAEHVELAGMNSPDAVLQQSGADPELAYSNTATWQERGPVETGSMPAAPGSSPDLRCCSGDSGPSVDAAGNSEIRHGIDDGS